MTMLTMMLGNIISPKVKAVAELPETELPEVVAEDLPEDEEPETIPMQ
jgi:hypothetical protein